LSIYADTSFFVSLYIPDAHTAEVERRLLAAPVVWLIPFHLAEFAHAVEQRVFRKMASRDDADRFLQLLEDDRRQGLWRETAMPEHAFDVCAQLARQYAARLGTRTLDSLHVASALELKADQFWTFDERQKQLALSVGLRAS
jgi:predicted nucleic acid-binding protein